MTGGRDHGGALDAARARWGGARADWIDLSTGINPVPWPVGDIPPADWCALPDQGAALTLEQAARSFWRVPDTAAILAAPGASCLIAALPHTLSRLGAGPIVQIRPDTYNEHAAAFAAADWQVTPGAADTRVIVHPNNPTGTFEAKPDTPRAIIDESFCDTDPSRSLVKSAGPGRIILKSFGKFWGLAGLRLGFAIGDPAVIDDLRTRLGPWPVSGPALTIATRALTHPTWAADTRLRLIRDAARLDALMIRAGARPSGDCPLFRLYTVPDATSWHGHFTAHRILTRIFPYAPTWLRLGLPGPDDWPRLERACGTVGGASAQPRAAQRP